MTLIVETGSIITGANSYVSDAEYTAYATSRGDTVGATVEAREAELFNAMDMLESYRDQFKGAKVTRDQPLQWPRYDVFIDGYQTDSNSIPVELQRAQMELALIVAGGTELAPSGTFENVQSEKLGSLSVSYFNGGKWSTVQTKNVDQFLNVLLLNAGGSLRSVRI